MLAVAGSSMAVVQELAQLMVNRGVLLPEDMSRLPQLSTLLPNARRGRQGVCRRPDGLAQYNYRQLSGSLRGGPEAMVTAARRRDATNVLFLYLGGYGAASSLSQVHMNYPSMQLTRDELDFAVLIVSPPEVGRGLLER